MSSTSSSRITAEQYYNERRQEYESAVHMNVLFPEIIATYSPRQLIELPLTYAVLSSFRDTLLFLGINILLMPNNIQGFSAYLRQNRIAFVLLSVYRRRLANDRVFSAFLQKIFQVKNEITQQLVDSDTEDSSDTSEGEGEDYVIPEDLASQEIPRFPHRIQIDDSHMGFDAIEGEKSVKDHLAENADNLVFILRTKSGGNSYFLSSKVQMKQLLKNRSNIQYVCKNYGPHMLAVYIDDVHYDKPLFKISSVGIPIPYVYLGEIKYLLESPYQLYTLSDEPIERPIALASNDILMAGEVASGIHCQHREGDIPYSIYSLAYVLEEDEWNLTDMDDATLVDGDADDDETITGDSDDDATLTNESPPPRKRMRAGRKQTKKVNKKKVKSKKSNKKKATQKSAYKKKKKSTKKVSQKRRR